MPTPDQLADTTALLFGVKRADIFSHNRTTRVAEARMALAWALRQNDWSLEAIGDYLGRDHTTIIYSLERIERRAEHSPRLAERLKALEDPLIPQPIDWRARVLALEARVKELEQRIGL